MDWSLQKVIEWLKLIKLEDKYIEVIKNHKINGKTLINMNHSELLFKLGIKPYGVRHNLLHEIKKLTSDKIGPEICKSSLNSQKIIEDYSLNKDNKSFINNVINISNSNDTVIDFIQESNTNINGVATNTGMNKDKENVDKISYMYELDPIKWNLNPYQSSNFKNSDIYNTWDLNLDKLREINKFRERLDINKSSSSEHCNLISANLCGKLMLSHIKEHYLAWRENILKNGAPKLETSETRKGSIILELINQLKAGLTSMLDNTIQSSYASESEMSLDLLKLDTYLSQIYLYTLILSNYSLSTLKGIHVHKLNQISKLLSVPVKVDSSKYSKFYIGVFDNKQNGAKSINVKQLATDLIASNIEDIKKFQRSESNDNNTNSQFSNCEFREVNGLMQENSIYSSSSYSEESNDTLFSTQSNYIVVSSDIYSDTSAEPEVIILSD